MKTKRNKSGFRRHLFEVCQLSSRKLTAIALTAVFVVFLIPFSHAKAENSESIRYSDSHVVDINGLSTEKTVERDTTDPNKFHVTLEAFAEKASIDQPITDIVMTMDLSRRMGIDLYTRNYKNLNTHTTFNKISRSDATYNHLHDPDNTHNDGSIDVGNSYSGNKYVEDPNTPGVYIYVACTYKSVAWLGWNHSYTYSFTDSLGNNYATDPIDANVVQSLSNTVGDLTFKLTNQVSEDAVSEVVISDFYQRSDDNATTDTLKSYFGTGTQTISDYSRQDNTWLGSGTVVTHQKERTTYDQTSLFIFSDTGEQLPVKVIHERTLDRTETYGAGIKLSTDDVISDEKYTYWCSDGENTYIAVQGNDVYGADSGVFQGFKVYGFRL